MKMRTGLSHELSFALYGSGRAYGAHLESECQAHTTRRTREGLLLTGTIMTQKFRHYYEKSFIPGRKRMTKQLVAGVIRHNRDTY